jgi:hypothetical protein
MTCFTVFELFLEVSTTVLVFAQTEKFPLEIFDSNSSETVD